VEKVPICLVGCGGMGHRHVMGYKELKDSGIGNLDLVAVCDIRAENAELVANEAERLLGRKPMVFTDLGQVLAHPNIAAVDVVTDGSTHHAVGVPALEAGKHTMVEKPLGITIRACQAMIDAAQRSGAVLATAENYRRDTPNRLVRAIIDHGLLGDPYLMIQTSLGGDDTMAITPWRHLKEKGAIGLDMGVHYADIIRYYMGEYSQIFGQGLIVEPVRRKPDHTDHPLISYRERAKTYPETVEATGEDSVIALYTMESGAVVQLSYVGGGRGSQGWERSVHGRWGAVYAPGERNGNPVVLRLEGRELKGKEILSLLPQFELNEITERFFGKQGVEYEPPADAALAAFAVDAKHLAIEYHDFGEAIRNGTSPEVDGDGGMKAVAAIVGAYESALAKRSVSMESVLSGEIREYQADIDAALGLDTPVN
jgi:predicted dehydrogenase